MKMYMGRIITETGGYFLPEKLKPFNFIGTYLGRLRVYQVDQDVADFIESQPDNMYIKLDITQGFHNAFAVTDELDTWLKLKYQ